MREKEYLEQYSLVPFLKEVAKLGFREGVNSANEDKEIVSRLLKENIELKVKVKDLEKCLLKSNLE